MRLRLSNKHPARQPQSASLWLNPVLPADQCREDRRRSHRDRDRRPPAENRGRIHRSDSDSCTSSSWRRSASYGACTSFPNRFIAETKSINHEGHEGSRRKTLDTEGSVDVEEGHSSAGFN